MIYKKKKSKKAGVARLGEKNAICEPSCTADTAKKVERRARFQRYSSNFPTSSTRARARARAFARSPAAELAFLTTTNARFSVYRWYENEKADDNRYL